MDKNEAKYTVYQITNLINNKIYVGVHKTYNINDRYMGSGVAINNAYQKYGMTNFKKEILFIFDNKEDMLNKEFEIVNEEFIKRKDTYNIMLGGTINNCGFVNVFNNEGKIIMIRKDDKRYLSGELKSILCEKITAKDSDGNILILNKNSDEWLSGNFTGVTKNPTQETRNKMSESHIGELNSQHGTCWIFNKELKINKKINKSDLDSYVNNNWIKGRNFKFSSSKHFKKIIISEEIINKIYEFRKQNMSYEKIAKKLNIGSTTVANYINNNLFNS